MNMIMKFFSPLVLLTFFATASVADLSRNEERPPMNPTPEQVQNAMEKLPPITLYGKVMDQDRNPVAQAEVQLSWCVPKLGFGWATDVRSEWITTEEDGTFKWTLIKGFQPSIQQLRKTGYEFTRNLSPFFQARDKDQQLVSTSRDKPLFLYLRKKGEATYLLKNRNNPLNLKVPLGGAVVHCPDIMPKTEMENNLREAGKIMGDRKIGFGANAEYLTNEPEYNITFVAPPGGGVVASDNDLCEAPAKGYQSEITVTFHSEKRGKQTFFPEKPIWLFIKTTEPVVYARIKLDVKLAWGDPLIYFDSTINPYGERNFEEETGLDYESRMELERQARISLRAGKLAEKPDLPSLIKGVKGKQQ